MNKIKKYIAKSYLEKEVSGIKHETPPKDGEEAWNRLLQGNLNYINGDVYSFVTHFAREISYEVRKQLSNEQKPFCVVITCTDSRIAPELIFDRGLGDLISIRLLGNVLDEMATGSAEYAINQLGCKLIVIMR